MSMLEKIHHGKENKPPRILLYGYEGCGKSTFAANAPKPVFIPTEDGIGQIEVDSFPLAQNVADVMTALEELASEQHDYRTVAVDSLSAFERMIHAEVCDHFSVKSIEQADGGYGKGYTYAAKNYWIPFISRLNALHQRGMMVILIAHVGKFTVQDPESGGYDRTGPLLHKTAVNLLHEWTDCTLLAEQKGVVSDKGGKTVVRSVGADGGERVLRCIGSIGTIAKNRYGMPMELPLDFDAVMEYFTK